MLQVAMTDLCPAGPIQAVEIQVESSSLADICRAHHAVVGRMQVCRPAREGGQDLGSLTKVPAWDPVPAGHGVCGSLPGSCRKIQARSAAECGVVQWGCGR